MFQYHHTGCLVRDMKTSVEFYTQTLGFKKVSEDFYISSQKVHVCFLENGPSSFLELVMPDEDNQTLVDMLNQKTNYYHIGYLVDDFDAALKAVENNTYRVNTFRSEAFNNKQCAFVFTQELHLIELIEK